MAHGTNERYVTYYDSITFESDVGVFAIVDNGNDGIGGRRVLLDA